MRRVALACAFLAIASVPQPARAASVPGPCWKPVVIASIPADGMSDVPINAVAQVWLGSEEIDCSEDQGTYRVWFAGNASFDAYASSYVVVAPDEQELLPQNSAMEIKLLEDENLRWSATFTTGSETAKPPVLPVEAELVSLTFEPVHGDDAHYHAFANVRFRPGAEDPFASAVLRPVGSHGESLAIKRDEDGYYDMIVGGLAPASTSFCVEPGIKNAAGDVAFGEPLCGDVPPPPAGCSVGGAPDGVGAVALLTVLLSFVRRRR